MAHRQAVMDVYPWPEGRGFKGATDWWSYVQSKNERSRLDLLIVMALLSEEVERLVLKHDPRLLEQFEFSDQTMCFLCKIETLNLSEFADAVSSRWPARP